jgi:hypothetical protein
MVVLIIVTLVSLAAAFVMGLIAWRIAGEERRRSEARVEALAADIRDVHIDDDRSAPVPMSDMFATGSKPERPRILAALVAGACIVGCAIGGVLLLSGGASDDSRSSIPQVPVEAAAARAAPLELAALEHERDGRRLIVRGIVRHGSGHQPLTAVVSALDREGRIVGTERAPVETAPASDTPDVESTFVVAIPGAGNAFRYRVGFRSDTQTIAHVDRREQRMTAELP